MSNISKDQLSNNDSAQKEELGTPDPSFFNPNNDQFNSIMMKNMFPPQDNKMQPPNMMNMYQPPPNQIFPFGQPYIINSLYSINKTKWDRRCPILLLI